MFRNQPIKRKLVGVILLTCLVVLMITCGMMLSYEWTTFRRAKVRDSSTLARVVAANSTASLAFDNQADARVVLSALAAEPDIIAAGLYDHGGRIFARYPDAISDKALPATPGDDGHRFAA